MSPLALFSTIFSELPNLLQLDTLVWWNIIISWSVFWKAWVVVLKVKVTSKVQTFSWIAVLKVKVTSKVQTFSWIAVLKVKVTSEVQTFNECSTGRVLLNRWTFCNQIWHGDAWPWTRVAFQKTNLPSPKIKVTVRAHVITSINLWLHLLYLPISSSFYNQT